MRLAALLERTASGWRGWVPALPGVEVEAPAASAAEEELARAVQAHVRQAWTAGELSGRPDIRCFSIDVRLRPAAGERHPPRQDEDEKRRTLERLDAVLSEGATLPRAVLNAVFAYRRDVRESLPEDEWETPAEPEPRLPENVVLFPSRED